jgi:hypothetical protein
VQSKVASINIKMQNDNVKSMDVVIKELMFKFGIIHSFLFGLSLMDRHQSADLPSL